MMRIGLTYRLDVWVGILPSVVYRISTSGVAHERVILTSDSEYSPGPGLKVGVATVCTPGGFLRLESGAGAGGAESCDVLA